MCQGPEHCSSCCQKAWISASLTDMTAATGSGAATGTPRPTTARPPGAWYCIVRQTGVMPDPQQHAPARAGDLAMLQRSYWSTVAQPPLGHSRRRSSCGRWAGEAGGAVGDSARMKGHSRADHLATGCSGHTEG